MTALAIGLMSGTSLDGVDAALVRIDSRDAIQLLAFQSEPYQSSTRNHIERTIAHGTLESLTLLDFDLGERFAAAACRLLKETNTDASSLSFVASHGQTVWHEPRRATMQLGNPAVVAERLGVRVVSDFRSRDIAAGGEGAPLVPIVDALLFGDPSCGRILLNVGGMANLTWVSKRGVTDDLVAFDTGPGVAVLDAVARSLDPSVPYDVNGERAARGKVVGSVVKALMENEYFSKAPPKSTGRERFGQAFAQNLVERVRNANDQASDEDCIATAVHLTVQSIVRAIDRWLGDKDVIDVVVSGGGRKNPVLMNGLRQALDALKILSFDDLFFDGDAKEAAAFAYLGWLTVQGMPGNVPSATGANGPRILGRITPG